MSKTEQAVIIPSDPVTRENLKRAIVDVSGQMTIAEGHKRVIKEGIDGIAEEYELPKKFVHKMARAYHMQNFNNQKTEFEDFEELYKTVIEGEVDDFLRDPPDEIYAKMVGRMNTELSATP